MEIEVSLTHDGLSRLGFDQDFQLKTDNAKDTIRCSKSQISFISPNISKLILNDPTTSEFTLTTKNSSKCSEILRSLLNGSTIKVKNDIISIFYSIMLELGNEEVLPNIEEELTIDNAIEIIQTKNIRLMDVWKEIRFIASHFIEMKQDEISLLDLSLIDNILSSDSLVVESEHDLFNFIYELISSHGDDYQILLYSLRLEFLEKEDISIFMSYINEDNVGSFIPAFYNYFINSQPLIVDDNAPKRYQIPVSYKNDNFQGILSLLWKEADGNPVTKQVIDIEDTTNCSQSKVLYLVDPEKRDKENWYCPATSNTENGSFIFDFKEKRVSLSGYSLKAHSHAWYQVGFIKSWKIEGSNDKETWTIIDEQKSDTLQSYMAVGHWSCEKSDPFRYIRIMMTGPNTNKDFYMSLQAIEFFGSISKGKKVSI